MKDTKIYYQLAKDSGNRLRAYILSVSSGATGVFFLALTKVDKSILSYSEKWLLTVALICFLLTVVFSLLELRIDAQRFFALAKELEKPEAQQSWSKNEKFKSKRCKLIYFSYISLGIAIISTCAYLILKITKT